MNNLRKFIVLFVILSIIILVSYGAYRAFYGSSTKEPFDAEEGNIDESFDTHEGSEGIELEYYKLGQNETIELRSNFPDPISARELKLKNDCRLLTSGGFYTPDSKNLGLFVSEGKVFSQVHNSRLLNGYVYIDRNEVNITSTYPGVNHEYILQTGPLVLLDNQLFDLNNANSEPARRILLGKSDVNEVFLFVVYNSESFYLGPKVSQVPEVIRQFEYENNLDITDLINLDGGSASAFIMPGLVINELKPIGSYFCVR